MSAGSSVDGDRRSRGSRTRPGTSSPCSRKPRADAPRPSRPPGGDRHGTLGRVTQVPAQRTDSASARASLVPSALVYTLLFTAVGAWSAYASVLFANLGVGLAV